MAVIAENVDAPLTLNGFKLPASKYKSPSVPTATSGNSFNTVVTSWTVPASRTPRALIQPRNQLAVAAVSAASAGLTAIDGTKTPR